MAALQCEICGGKLVGKPGGIFECDSCGVEYSTEWAKAKVQEIRGTVKIEGPVQVEGTVTVEGGVNLAALLKRGDLALADGEWDKAKEYFDQALNMDAECGHAYFGLTMADLRCGSREEFAKLYEVNDCAHDKSLQKAKQFAGETRDYLTRLDAEIEDKIKMTDEDRRQAAIRLAPVRERIKPASGMIATTGEEIFGVKVDGTVVTTYWRFHDASRWKDIIAVAMERWRNVNYNLVGLKADGTVEDSNSRCRTMMSNWTDITAIGVFEEEKIAGLKTDGTILQINSDGSATDMPERWQDIAMISKGGTYLTAIKSDGTVLTESVELQSKVSDWKDIVAVESGLGYIVGLRADGTVVATGDTPGFPYGQCDVSRWRDIVSIATGLWHTVGLKADGTVVAVGGNESWQCNTRDWTDVVAVAASDNTTVALKADGTVVSTRSSKAKTWKLFDSLESLSRIRAETAARRGNEAKQQRLEEEQRLEAERREAERLRMEAERQEEERRRIEAERQGKIFKLKSERESLHLELANLKGLFSGGRRKELEAKLARIENDLKGLN